MVGITGHAVADHLAEDRCPTGFGVFQGLEHQNAGTFTDHEAIAFLVERTAGCGRIVIAEGQCFGTGETGNPQGRDC